MPEETKTTPLADTGDLALIPFPRLFAALCRERRTGRLDVRDKPKEAGGKIFKRLVMSGGAKFVVQGGTMDETLPELLRAAGRLKPEELEKLKSECGGDYGKMEQKVLTGAVIPPHELGDLVALQAGAKIRQLFSLIRGVYEWKTLAETALPDRNLLVPLVPEKILFEGVKQHYHADRVKMEFPGIEKKAMALAPDFKGRAGAFGLPAPAARWLRELTDGLSIASAVKAKALPEEDGFALLLACYLGGLLTLPPNEEETFPLGRAYMEKTAGKPVEKKPVEEKKAEAKPAAAPVKKEEPKLPIEEVLDAEMTDDQLITRLDEFLAIAKDPEKNYFDLLGVQEMTPPAKIKQVYFKFAKRFHPDARPDLFVDEVRDRVEDFFTKISEAYNVLGDGESRTTYAKNIKSKISKEDMEKASRAIEAEMEFQKAEALLKKSAWRPALELLDRAVSLMPDEPEYRLYRLWASYKIKGPSEASATRRELDKISADRPQNADVWFYLGQLAREDGRLDEAEKHFEKASSMKPHDVDIKRELQLLYRRKDKAAAEPKKGGGLFGKKK